MRRQATDWEKISAKDITDNELLCKVYNKTLQTQPKKTHEKPDEQIGKRPEQTPHQRRYTDGKHIKRCSTLCH